MDVLLTHGYFLAEDPVEQKINKPYPPLGLLYLSAYLKENGFEPRVFDSTFSTPSALAEHIKTTKPDVVGFYVNMMTRKQVLPLLPVCKEAGATVILGGPEPVNYLREYLQAGADIIVIGEGESTTLEVIERIESGGTDYSDIPGIAYLAQGRAIETASRQKLKRLDELPFPDRGAIDMHRYLDLWKTHHGASSVSLITARGCPYTCRWCSHSVYGFSYRTRSPENVADEIALIRETYDPDQVWYADDVFTINPKWVKRYAQELTRRGLHIPFETISREDRLDDDVIADLVTMQCTRIWVGAESGSQTVLDAMDRRTSAKRTREVIKRLQASGIRAGTFIMFGYPGEGWNELTETYEHLTEAVPDDLLTTTAYPIKGTPFHDEVEDRIIARETWPSSSDRELTLDGARTSTFYDFAGKWMQAGVKLNRADNLKSVLKNRLSLVINRLGMYLTWRLRTKPSSR